MNGGIKAEIERGYKKYLKEREKMMAKMRAMWNHDIIYWKDL